LENGIPLCSGLDYGSFDGPLFFVVYPSCCSSNMINAPCFAIWNIFSIGW